MHKPILPANRLIEVRSVSKSYASHKVVDQVSFEAKQGETLILLGTSGCGKTTTLKMINRLVEPDLGEIYIQGRLNTSVPGPDLRRGIGYVLQDTGLFPHLSVAENIAIVPRLLGWDKERIRLRTFSLLEHFGLEGERMYREFPGNLSGGQKQRIGFVRALIASPPILLMDEPFGALDPVTRLSIRKDFKNLPELQDKCIIMVTHDIQEAFQLGDRIILMDNGKIQQIGSPIQLVKKPSNNFVKQFLSHQYLFLQFQIRSLENFFDRFFLEAPDGIIIGKISSLATIQEAFENFSPDQDLEVLEIRNHLGLVRFTHSRQLLSLLASDLQ